MFSDERRAYRSRKIIVVRCRGRVARVHPAEAGESTDTGGAIGAICFLPRRVGALAEAEASTITTR